MRGRLWRSIMELAGVQSIRNPKRETHPGWAAAFACLTVALSQGCSDNHERRTPVGPSGTPGIVDMNPGNDPPVVREGIPPQHVEVDGEPTLIPLPRYFGDPDGDTLTYEAASSDRTRITTDIANNILELRGHQARKATVTITARDPSGLTATQEVTYRTTVRLAYKVWSKNGPDGESYEYQSGYWNHDDRSRSLQDSYLWIVSRVVVKAPDGRTYELEKDFNIQTYSGEVTRRWVLYGPPGAGFPQAGNYTFQHHIDGNVDYEHVVSYSGGSIGYPTDVRARRNGNDLVVDWTPATNVPPGTGASGKVILFPHASGAASDLISQLYELGASSARLPGIPMRDGDRGLVHVTLVFWYNDNPNTGGYAYSEYIPIIW